MMNQKRENLNCRDSARLRPPVSIAGQGAPFGGFSNESAARWGKIQSPRKFLPYNRLFGNAL